METQRMTTEEQPELKLPVLIFFAETVGRKFNAIGIFTPIRTYCYGNSKHEAILSLYDHFEHLLLPKLTHCPVVRLGDVKDGDRIYLIGDDGKIIRDSAFKVLELTNATTRKCLRASTGVDELLSVDLPCIRRVEGA